jgi:hypothetical protein
MLKPDEVGLYDVPVRLYPSLAAQRATNLANLPRPSLCALAIGEHFRQYSALPIQKGVSVSCDHQHLDQIGLEAIP